MGSAGRLFPLRLGRASVLDRVVILNVVDVSFESGLDFVGVLFTGVVVSRARLGVFGGVLVGSCCFGEVFLLLV